MIAGIGTDIVAQERIARVLSRSYGAAFKNRVFTEHEQEYCDKLLHFTRAYAARWALKEAFYKALPIHLQAFSHWKTIELFRGKEEKPLLRICDSHFAELLKKEKISGLHHSISHDKDYCIATVILEYGPDQE